MITEYANVASAFAASSATRRTAALALLGFTGLALAPAEASAACNGGALVTGALTIASSCDGGGSNPLKLGTGADVTINSGVTVSNDAWSGRNGDPVAVPVSTASASLINNGTVSTAQQWGVTVSGTLTTLENFGTIVSNGRRGVVIQSGGSIGTLTNAGVISGPFEDVTDSSYAGSIGTLNNRQGAGNAGGALTYFGALPTNYNVVIDSPTSYGQLRLDSDMSGPMTFGIYDGGVSGLSASTVAVGTYQDVLIGFSSLNGIGGTTGAYHGLAWALVADPNRAGAWSLAVTQQAAAAPEPATWALMLAGFAGLGVAGYRVRRAPARS